MVRLPFQAGQNGAVSGRHLRQGRWPARSAAAQALEIHFAQRLVQADAWDSAIADAEKKAQALEDFTRAELYRVLGTAQADADMSNLARSAARPGLKERLLRYIAK